MAKKLSETQLTVLSAARSGEAFQSTISDASFLSPPRPRLRTITRQVSALKDAGLLYLAVPGPKWRRQWTPTPKGAALLDELNLKDGA